MPILNIRIGGEAEDGRGNIASLSPNMALQMIGPVVPVILSPLEAHLKAVADRKDDMPPPISGRAMIDTGAATTCVDIDAARKADLAQVDSGIISSATHANEQVPVFAGQLAIESTQITINTHRAIGANLAPHKLVALIGRELLAQCVFVYNGSDSSFSLSI